MIYLSLCYYNVLFAVVVVEVMVPTSTIVFFLSRLYVSVVMSSIIAVSYTHLTLPTILRV